MTFIRDLAARPVQDGRSFDLTSISAFRRSTMKAKQAGSLLWFQSRGLAIDSSSWHAAFCRCLRRFNLGGDTSRTAPTCAVFDWSTCEDTSAEALAMFAVVVRRLRADDVAV